MNDIDSRLDAYPALRPDERAEVEAYVRAHPEWAGRLAEAQAFAALLDAAADRGDLARYVVDERMGLDLDPAMTAALADDPDLRAEADRLRARLDALVAGAADPAATFERLTGRTLDRAPAPIRPPAAADRAAVRRAAPRRLPRWVALAATVVLVAYGGLYAISAGSLSDRARLADLADLPAYEPTSVRGEVEEALAVRLDATLDVVAEARRSTAGLFPRYDAEALDAVASDLEQIVAEAPRTSAVSQEARLALGRVRLAQSRDDEAARVLGTLAREGGYLGPEARRLLDAIRAGE
ncbi:MAG: hypothetical protein AAF845_06650 [Bacteroidota bacterium]